MMNHLASSHKIAISWIGVFLFRLVLLPLRAPNVEPLMATLMPASQRLSVFGSVAFAVLSIVLYDLVTSGIGVWSLAAGGAYGLVALASHWYFAGRAATRSQYVGFAVISTLLFDAVTGLTVGPLVFGQTIEVALAGQIPFTLLHLAGNVTLAAILSPLIARWLAEAPTAVPATVRQAV